MSALANLTDATTFLTVRELDIIGWAFLVSSVLSLLGAGSVIVVSVWRGKCFKENVFPVFHLSLADSLASYFMISSVVFYFYYESDPVVINVVCKITAMLTMALYETTFLVTIGYAIQIYIRLDKQENRRQYQTYSLLRAAGNMNWIKRALYTCAWFVPILAAAILVLTSAHHVKKENDTPRNCFLCLPVFHYGAAEPCKPKRDVPWYARELLFIVPLLGVMLGNSVIYVFSLRTYRRVEAARGIVDGDQFVRIRRIRWRLILYQSIFIVCWLPSLALGSVVIIGGVVNTESIYWLYVIQAMTAPLQGFLNSVVYAWRRSSFIGSLARPLTPCPSYSRGRAAGLNSASMASDLPVTLIYESSATADDLDLRTGEITEARSRPSPAVSGRLDTGVNQQSPKESTPLLTSRRVQKHGSLKVSVPSRSNE